MEIDSRARALVIRGLHHTQKLYNEQFNFCIKNMMGAKTVEELMDAKKNLLHGLLYYFPLNSDVCYFCIECENRCTKCGYAKHHGYCGVNDSLWCKLSNMIQEADGFVVEEYVKKDEKYE